MLFSLSNPICRPFVAFAARLAAFIAMSPFAAFAGFGSEEFQDDPSIRQDDDLEWPEVSFPAPDARGGGFRHGESFEFRAQWGVFRKAGLLSIRTESSQVDGENAFLIHTESKSAGVIRKLYPMDLTALTVLDPDQWRVVRNVTDGKTRSDSNASRTLVDYERSLLLYEDVAEPDRNKIRELPYDCPLDYVSALLQIRGWDLEVGGIYPLLLTSKGKFYYIQLQVSEMETVESDIGDIECFRVDPLGSFPQSKLFREGGKLSIWISADARRIPVRCDVKTSVGTASLRLGSYEIAPAAAR